MYESIFECMKLFSSEMNEAENMDFFVSGRGLGIVISIEHEIGLEENKRKIEKCRNIKGFQ